MGHHFRPARRQRIFEACGWICLYCQRDLGKLPHSSRGQWGLSGIITIDHKIPITKGGTHKDENLTIACWICNIRKGSDTSDEYLERILRK